MTGQPTRLSGWLHFAKVTRHRLLRSVRDRRDPLPLLARAKLDGVVIAEHRSKLYVGTEGELPLELGKIQNLRLAATSLDRLVVPGGAVFSFWKQVGRCSKSRGYVVGRQLQEGCLIPAIGGGICQLSNALYQVAECSGMEILERHTQSRIVPGSAASLGQDATVAWNYVDFRFRATQTVQIRARLTDDELVVQLVASTKPATRDLRAAQLQLKTPANSCDTCGRETCFKNAPSATVASREGYVLDAVSPEWLAWLAGRDVSQAILLSPIDGRRWRKPAYAWPLGFAGKVFATIPSLTTALKARKAAPNQGARQARAIARATQIGNWFAKHLPIDVTKLFISQDFVGPLWSSGDLGGRRFVILADRLPMKVIQEQLDKATQIHPDSVTLGDFRADPELVQAEADAFEAAATIVTPHAYLAELYASKAELIPWILPPPATWTPGPALAFGGPAVARKGAFEVREVALKLQIPVVTTGRNLEGEGFWDGVQITFKQRDDAGWLDGCFAVVQPAVVEGRPHALLQAQASGVPIICTKACGVAGATVVPDLSGTDLEQAVLRIRTTCQLKSSFPV